MRGLVCRAYVDGFVAFSHAKLPLFLPLVVRLMMIPKVLLSQRLYWVLSSLMLLHFSLLHSLRRPTVRHHELESILRLQLLQHVLHRLWVLRGDMLEILGPGLPWDEMAFLIGRLQTLLAVQLRVKWHH